LPKIPPIRLLPRDAFLADTEFVPFKLSAGRICAEVITPYPPGIPVISPGEEISPEIIDYLALEKKAGVKMQGPYDDALRFIRVVR
jgi:arginine/lysine/ornithine decarboxylase